MLKDCNVKSNLQLFNLLRNPGFLFHALIKSLQPHSSWIPHSEDGQIKYNVQG